MQPTPETRDNLYDDALLYDRICHALGNDDAEPAFYAGLLPPAPHHGHHPQVLELGCGSGRLALQLAARGLQVVGVDNSASMLAVAREKTREKAGDTMRQGHQPAAPKPEWHLQDLRHFCLGRRFALVLLPSNNLAHLHTLADLQACLQCVLEHLADDGLLVIDYFNPSVVKLALGPAHEFPVLAEGPVAAPTWSVTETSAYDAATQTSAVCWRAQFEPGQTVQLHFKLRIWYPQELDALLQLNGLRLVSKFGGYQQQPFDSQASRQLLVCARAAPGTRETEQKKLGLE